YTPLFCAIKYKQVEIVELLLSNKNIDVNKPNKKGEIPLIFCIINKEVDCLKLLLKHKDININSTYQ
ncbi:hypothetical protein BCR32DRAFT_194022, partial [Anaeromyces robustus]